MSLKCKLISFLMLLMSSAITSQNSMPLSYFTFTPHAESVNGSSEKSHCSMVYPTFNGEEITCFDPSSSILFDGKTPGPMLEGLSGNLWASQLFTLHPPSRTTEIKIRYGQPLVLGRIEIVVFNCPEWGIAIGNVTVQDFGSSQQTIARYVLTEETAVSCNSLVRICIPAFPGSTATDRLSLNFTLLPESEWVHIAEIAVYTGSMSTCPLSPITSTTEASRLTNEDKGQSACPGATQASQPTNGQGGQSVCSGATEASQPTKGNDQGQSVTGATKTAQATYEENCSGYHCLPSSLVPILAAVLFTSLIIGLVVGIVSVFVKRRSINTQRLQERMTSFAKSFIKKRKSVGDHIYEDVDFTAIIASYRTSNKGSNIDCKVDLVNLDDAVQLKTNKAYHTKTAVVKGRKYQSQDLTDADRHARKAKEVQRNEAENENSSTTSHASYMNTDDESQVEAYQCIITEEAEDNMNRDGEIHQVNDHGAYQNTPSEGAEEKEFHMQPNTIDDVSVQMTEAQHEGSYACHTSYMNIDGEVQLQINEAYQQVINGGAEDKDIHEKPNMIADDVSVQSTEAQNESSDDSGYANIDDKVQLQTNEAYQHTIDEGTDTEVDLELNMAYNSPSVPMYNVETQESFSFLMF